MEGVKWQNCQNIAAEPASTRPLPHSPLSWPAPAAAAGAARRSTVHLRPLAVWIVAPVAMPTCRESQGFWCSINVSRHGCARCRAAPRRPCALPPNTAGTTMPGDRQRVRQHTHRLRVLQPEAEAAQQHDERHRRLGDGKLVADALARAAACGRAGIRTAAVTGRAGGQAQSS